MKRLFVIFTLLAILSTALALPASGALSGAMEHLAQDAVLVKTARMGESISFCDADFRRALGVTSYPDITLLTLPDPREGTLKLGGLRVSQGQTVKREQISLLSFTPATHLTEEGSFTFQAGNLCGGAPLCCSLIFTERTNSAPTSFDGEEPCFSFAARKNVSVFGTLSAYDPEGDALTYLIISYPKKGSLVLTDKTAGAFRYTPRVSFEGTDSFTFVVRDSLGAYSAPSRVTLRIEGGEIDADPEGLPSSHLEAQEDYLVACGILPSGEGEALTKGEFLAAAMRASGSFPAACTQTYLDNNDSIPPHLRPAIASALSSGVISPTYERGELTFDWDTALTRGEALEILARLLPDYTLPAAWQSSPTDAPLSWHGAIPLLHAVTTLPQQ